MAKVRYINQNGEKYNSYTKKETVTKKKNKNKNDYNIVESIKRITDTLIDYFINFIVRSICHKIGGLIESLMENF